MKAQHHHPHAAAKARATFGIIAMKHNALMTRFGLLILYWVFYALLNANLIQATVSSHVGP